MSQLSNKALLRFQLNNQAANAPIEWQDIEVLATFDNDSIQANITTDQFTFTLEEAEQIRQWILNGLIFEGLPFQMEAYNVDSNYTTFDGFLDLSDEFEDLPFDNKVKAKLKARKGLNSFEERLSALSYGYLESATVGLFSDSDYTTIEYVVEKKDNAFDILVSTIVLYLMVKELAEGIYNSADAVANISSKAVIGPFGPLGSLVYTIAIAIITVAYTAVMAAIVLRLATDLLSVLVSPKRESKCILLRTAFEKVINYLGYTLDTNITDLDNYYYLPSNIRTDEYGIDGLLSVTKGTEKGIPNTTDYGYKCSEMFELIKDMFDAKFAIQNGVVYFYNKYDPFWVRQSTYQAPDHQTTVKRYNTNELIANRLISFETDIQDVWTIDNFEGTNYEVITDAVNNTDPEAKFIKGLEELRLPVALGNRKNELNALEKIAKEVAGAADAVLNFFGGNSNLKGKVKSRIGVLKIGDNNYTRPKVLYLSGGKIPSNHRGLLSASYLYDTYHYGKSFVENNYYGQKEVYTGVRFGFGLSDFLQLIENSYFTTSDNQQAKATKILWRIAADYATVDYYIRTPYTKQLSETKIEPA